MNCTHLLEQNLRLFLSGDILFQNGPVPAAIAFSAAIVGLTGLTMGLTRHGFQAPIPLPIALLVFALSVGCFLLDRDIANICAVATLALIAAVEGIAWLRRDRRPTFVPKENS